MTKSDLVKRLADANPHLYTRDVERIVAVVFNQIAAALARGDRRMISFLEGLPVREVPEDELRRLDPELQSFFNINTGEDLDQARAIADPGSHPPAAPG